MSLLSTRYQQALADKVPASIKVKLDDHLANFLGVWKTFSQVKGKKGIPAYRIKKSSITATSNGLVVIKSYLDAPLVRENKDAKEWSIAAVRRPYIPLNVFKCMAKMGLSIMPENEMMHFHKTIEWLMNEDKLFDYLPLLYEYVPKQNAFKRVTAVLLKRKETVFENVPYMYFFLIIKNLRLQIYIPQCERDKKMTGKVTIYHFPSPYSFLSHPSVKPQLGIYDLSSAEMIRNHPDLLTFSYESKIETNLFRE